MSHPTGKQDDDYRYAPYKLSRRTTVLTATFVRSESSSAVSRGENEDHVSIFVSAMSWVVTVKSFLHFNFSPGTLAPHCSLRALAGLDHHIGQTLLLDHLVVVDEDQRYGRETRRRTA